MPYFQAQIGAQKRDFVQKRQSPIAHALWLRPICDENGRSNALILAQNDDSRVIYTALLTPNCVENRNSRATVSNLFRHRRSETRFQHKIVIQEQAVQSKTRRRLRVNSDFSRKLMSTGVHSLFVNCDFVLKTRF